MKQNTIDKSELKPGDVILCYARETRGKSEALSSGYSHAAICLDGQAILEASLPNVRETDVDHLFEEYSHIAVLRGSELWGQDRIDALKKFAKDNIGKPFNSTGLLRCEKRREEIRDDAMERVHGYFEGSFSVSADKNVYFCSELVTSAFIKVGIIHESAAVLFAPDAFAPQDIGADKAFGFFVGYIIPDSEYIIPGDDVFINSV